MEPEPVSKPMSFYNQNRYAQFACQFSFHVTEIQPNPDTAPRSVNTHESLSTKIPHHSVFRFITTLDISPQTAVNKQWNYITVGLYLVTFKEREWWLSSSFIHLFVRYIHIFQSCILKLWSCMPDSVRLKFCNAVEVYSTCQRITILKQQFYYTTLTLLYMLYWKVCPLWMSLSFYQYNASKKVLFFSGFTAAFSNYSLLAFDTMKFGWLEVNCMPTCFRRL